MWTWGLCFDQEKWGRIFPPPFPLPQFNQDLSILKNWTKFKIKLLLPAAQSFMYLLNHIYKKKINPSTATFIRHHQYEKITCKKFKHNCFLQYLFNKRRYDVKHIKFKTNVEFTLTRNIYSKLQSHYGKNHASME